MVKCTLYVLTAKKYCTDSKNTTVGCYRPGLAPSPSVVADYYFIVLHCSKKTFSYNNAKYPIPPMRRICRESLVVVCNNTHSKMSWAWCIQLPWLGLDIMLVNLTIMLFSITLKIVPLCQKLCSCQTIMLVWCWLKFYPWIHSTTQMSHVVIVVRMTAIPVEPGNAGI